FCFFFFQAEDGIRGSSVTGVQTCALPISPAAMMAMDPEILFFDEPSAGLDPIIAAGVDELILELKKAFHMTIVVVTHELASAFRSEERRVGKEQKCRVMQDQ